MGTKHRSILFFPQFESVGAIERLRAKYDPLAQHVRPHITLVFPFRSGFSQEELALHVVKAAAEVRRFRIELQGITAEQGNYLFLNFRHGAENVIDLHKRLYRGLLEPFFPEFLKKTAFVPHLTVGRPETAEALLAAAAEAGRCTESFTAVLTEISVELIEDNLDSTLEFSVPLG